MLSIHDDPAAMSIRLGKASREAASQGSFVSKLRYGLCITVVIAAAPATAWGPDGHHTVGVIAEQLIVGTHAAVEVKAVLGSIRLRDAAVWADCAKGVDPSKSFAYTSAGRFPECRRFETPMLEAEMIDFVKRNDTNCARKPTEESCHKQYHYTDVAIQRPSYSPGLVGTRNDDIVAAVAAAVAVLKDEGPPAPFDIASKREALLLLAHYVGDIHQPLHVGAVYLDTQGKRVDPDQSAFDPATETRGGNQIVTLKSGVRGANLHRIWDNIPTSLNEARVKASWLAAARAVPVTPGAPGEWSAVWASETLRQAGLAFAVLRFGKKQGMNWTVALSASYESTMNRIKKRQLTEAGARLAQLLETIWP